VAVAEEENSTKKLDVVDGEEERKRTVKRKSPVQRNRRERKVSVVERWRNERGGT